MTRTAHPRARAILAVLAMAGALGADAPGAARGGGGSVAEIRVGQAFERFGMLKPGTRLYIRFRLKDGVATPIDLQTKELRFPLVEGHRRLRITQRWQGEGGHLELDSWFEAGTFRPLTHSRTTTRDGAAKTEAFEFLGNEVRGTRREAGKAAAEFSVASPVAPFNFETDLETLQSLPLRPAAEFKLVFYHPGGQAPAVYSFKVAGEEVLRTPLGNFDCWVVTTDYNAPGHPVSRFWFAKSSQLAVRTESPLKDGSTIVKALVLASSEPTAAEDRRKK